jgi:cysteine dioxygenase
VEVLVLRRLIDDLRARGPLERGNVEVGALLSAAGDDWGSGRPLIARANTYTRTCAYRDDCFEIVLLNWDRGAASPIHDHGDQHCWMMVLQGGLWVEDYVRLDAADVPGFARVERRDTRALGKGEMDLRSGRFDLHRVTAANRATTVTLHLYGAPLRSFLVYDESKQRCETAYGTYDEVMSAYTGSVR